MTPLVHVPREPRLARSRRSKALRNDSAEQESTGGNIPKAWSRSAAGRAGAIHFFLRLFAHPSTIFCGMRLVASESGGTSFVIVEPAPT